ncbi:MAG: hypothetical protein APF80_11390 [Alphaproteobacteria bacterium BRH_c36]|nr:MAG: hypothetical protein APF80_11390 [Alphaproteobacteria bacterium BRH_c36]
MILANEKPQQHPAQADAFMPDEALRLVFLAKITSATVRETGLMVAPQVMNNRVDGEPTCDAGSGAGGDLDRLAEAHGIATTSVSETGEARSVTETGKRALLCALGVPSGDDEAVRESLAGLASTPQPEVHAAASATAGDSGATADPAVRCFVPEWMDKGRAWGITCQLLTVEESGSGYGQHHHRNHCSKTRTNADHMDNAICNSLCRRVGQVHANS